MTVIGNKRRFALEIAPVQPSWERCYPAEEAGWAGLSVWVDGTNLCQHSKPGTDRIEDRLFVPLGPLADWLVRAWPAIALEERRPLAGGASPRRLLKRWFTLDPPRGVEEGDWYEKKRGWWSRHFFEAGSAGAIVPDLAFLRDGQDLILDWAQVTGRGSHAVSGTSQVSWAEFRETAQAFVTSVGVALQAAGVDPGYSWLTSRSPLDASLEAITPERALELFVGQNMSTLSGWLGVNEAELLQRFRLSGRDPTASLLAQIAHDLPPAPTASLIQAVLRVDDAAQELAECPDRSEYRRLASEASRVGNSPELQGHEAAKILRDSRGLDGQPVSNADLEDFTAHCGIDLLGNGLNDAPSGPTLGRGPHALLGEIGGKRAAALLLNTKRLEAEWARRFELSRLIGVSVQQPVRGGVLGFASSPWASQLSRRRSGAFAAEFLLPESGIVARGLGRLDAALQGTAFRELLDEFRIGAIAAAMQLWNLNLLSSEELRDELIEEHATLDP